MGRRKLEMKRIEDKSSRQVAFSKRRAGLMKKARHLSVLCDVDVGVVIFSGRGKLYEFCSRSSLGEILLRYERCILEPEAAVATGACEAKEINTQSASFRTSGELLEMVQRYAEEPCLEQLNVPDLLQLEEDLYAALMQTRIRQTQLMMEYAKSLHEKEKVLCEENKEMEQKVAGMKNGDDIDKAPDLNVPAASQMNCVPKRVTLPLFTK